MQSKSGWLWVVAAVIMAGAAWALGAPPSTILLVAVLLGCCGAMLFGMRGMHGNSGETRRSYKVDDSERHSGDDEHRAA